MFQTPFTVSVDHAEVAQCGVTAAARALTIRKILDAGAQAAEFVSPGHVFPLIASPVGVLGRQGQTEGSNDLARLAGFEPAGVLCEILAQDGSMLRGRGLEDFALKHNLKITTVAEVARYRIQNEVFVRESAEARLNTGSGLCKTIVYTDDVDRKEHLVLQFGSDQQILSGEPVLTRVHSECLTGDVFGSRRCDCGSQLCQAVSMIAQSNGGLILYLRQEGRGIGLANKLKAYALQDHGHDTVEANLELGFEPDLRDFAVAARILKSRGISRIRLITNNPRKVKTLESLGIEVAERVPSSVKVDDFNRNYLLTKKIKLGHLLDPVD